jgi:hypothetical protein
MILVKPPAITCNYLRPCYGPNNSYEHMLNQDPEMCKLICAFNQDGSLKRFETKQEYLVGDITPEVLEQFKKACELVLVNNPLGDRIINFIPD